MAHAQPSLTVDKLISLLYRYLRFPLLQSFRLDHVNMSFGFSPSDIFALLNIVKKTSRGWKSACGEYADVTSSLDHLLILLERVKDEAEKPRSAVVRNKRDAEDLNDIVHACDKTVSEVNAVLTKFQSLGQSRSRARNWDRLRFGSKNLDSLRSRLQQHGVSVAVYLDTVGLSSLARIENQTSALSEQIRNAAESLTAEIRNGHVATQVELGPGLLPDKMQRTVDCLVKDINSGRREGSIMTTYSDDEKDVWRQFRQELIGEGFRSSEIHKLKPRIVLYLKALAGSGLLEEAELAPMKLGKAASSTPLSDIRSVSKAKVSPQSDSDEPARELQKHSAKSLPLRPANSVQIKIAGAATHHPLDHLQTRPDGYDGDESFRIETALETDTQSERGAHEDADSVEGADGNIDQASSLQSSVGQGAAQSSIHGAISAPAGLGMNGFSNLPIEVDRVLKRVVSSQVVVHNTNAGIAESTKPVDESETTRATGSTAAPRR